MNLSLYKKDINFIHFTNKNFHVLFQMITSPQSSQYIFDILVVVNVKIMVLSLFQYKDDTSGLLLNVGTVISNCTAAHLRVCMLQLNKISHAHNRI
jgi:hypothetical protein